MAVPAPAAATVPAIEVAGLACGYDGNVVAFARMVEVR